MRHGKYGLTVASELTDDQIKTALSPAALKELEASVKDKAMPVTFLISEAVGPMVAGQEFTVLDMFVMLHDPSYSEYVPEKPIKVHTLRTSLAAMARNESRRQIP
jgi:hypothetical protein